MIESESCVVGDTEQHKRTSHSLSTRYLAKARQEMIGRSANSLSA
jgi:hypothetical protein